MIRLGYHDHWHVVKETNKPMCNWYSGTAQQRSSCSFDKIPSLKSTGMNCNWIVSRNENAFLHHYYVNRSVDRHSSQLVESGTKEMIRRWITIIRSPAVSGSVSRADCVKHVMTTDARSATRDLWCRSSAAVATGHRLLLSASGPGRVRSGYCTPELRPSPRYRISLPF